MVFGKMVFHFSLEGVEKLVSFLDFVHFSFTYLIFDLIEGICFGGIINFNQDLISRLLTLANSFNYVR